MQWLNNYLLSPTHKWWVDNVWRPSWTRFTTMVYGLPALLVGAFQAVSKFAGDTTISGYLAQMNIPNWVPSALALIALVHYISQGHED